MNALGQAIRNFARVCDALKRGQPYPHPPILDQRVLSLNRLDLSLYSLCPYLECNTPLKSYSFRVARLLANVENYLTGREAA